MWPGGLLGELVPSNVDSERTLGICWVARAKSSGGRISGLQGWNLVS